MFDIHTVGGSPAAELLGESLQVTEDKAFKRSLLRHLNTYYTNVAIMAAGLPKSQRELALWNYFKSTMTSSKERLEPKFAKAGVSFSLYESVAKTAIRKALRREDEFEELLLSEVEVIEPIHHEF